MNLEASGVVLERIVAKAGTLYTLPAVAVEVLQLTSHPKVDVQRLRQCIERDPALATRVLGVVNSSLFGLGHQISDLSQALALLGTKPLKLLVLGFSLPDNLFIGVAGDILRRYWRRTLTKAVAAREISATVWKLPGDDAFLAGLLQDIGLLVLIQEFGEPFVKLLDAAFAKSMDVGTLVAKSIGFDHAQLSARLLERWGLPQNLVDAIAAGRPAATIADLPATVRCLPQILHLAELLSSLVTENRTDLLPDLLAAAEGYHSLRINELPALVASLQEKVEQLADVLKLELPLGMDYTAVMLKAHERLSDVAADAAAELLRGPRRDELEETEDVLAELQALKVSVRRVATSTELQAKSEVHLEHPVHGPLTADVPRPTLLRKELWGTAQPTGQAQAVRADTGETTEFQAMAPPAGEIDPGFLGDLATMAASCRSARCAMSVVLIGIDRYDELVMARGVSGAERIVAFLGESCQALGATGSICRRAGDDQFAMLLPAADRQAAVAIGNQLLSDMRRLAGGTPGQVRSALTVSVGIAAVAVPPKNFIPSTLIDSAERCLHAARMSGGNALKSIEIY